MKKKSIIKYCIFLILLVIVAGVGFGMRPICSPIADEALSHFGIPIQERQDRDFYLKVFQQKEDGHWYQCKTAMSRAFFF
jgi:hypothetical protein